MLADDLPEDEIDGLPLDAVIGIDAHKLCEQLESEPAPAAARSRRLL
jgi:hypothetical protein